MLDEKRRLGSCSRTKHGKHSKYADSRAIFSCRVRNVAWAGWKYASERDTGGGAAHERLSFIPARGPVNSWLLAPLTGDWLGFLQCHCTLSDYYIALMQHTHTASYFYECDSAVDCMMTCCEIKVYCMFRFGNFRHLHIISNYLQT